MPVKLLTSGGGGVNLVPSSSIASDQTMYLPTSGTSGGTVLCIDSTGGTANGVLYLNGSKQVTSGSGLVFDSSGSLLVGTTNSLGGKLTVSGNVIASNNADCFTARPTGSQTGFVYAAASSTGQAAYFMVNNGANESGKITCTSTSTTYATSSDYRLKENIQPMQNALDVVAQLKPVTYNWKADGSDGQGFIAHELQAVVPDCVIGEKDAVDEEGKPVYQGIDTSFLVATLTAAIQEQQAIIESQAQTIESLTQRIEALEYTKQGE